ncbi:hypothetical protein [Dyadobacter sp.]|uniref:hypothetical protein n=1 Tax=Dyadobacter sp. TaxID=1914288 RepID=UPI003F6F44CE
MDAQKPLVVYLDTHDYSKLYSDKSAEMQNIANYLFDKVDSGEIIIPYSYFIVAELLTAFTEEYRTDRLQRVGILKRLCGSNTFRFIDADSFMEGTLSDSGNWYPKFEAWEYLKKGLDEQTEHLLNSLPIGLSMKIDKKNPWPQLFRIAPQLISSISQVAKLLPVPKSFCDSHLLVRYLKGEVSEAFMRQETATILTDLNLFFTFWFENEMNKNVSLLHELIRTAGNPYLNLANDLVALSQEANNRLDQINALAQADFIAVKSLKKELKVVRSTLNNFQKLDIDFVKSFIPDKSIFDRLPQDFGDTILKYAIGVAKGPRKTIESDTGDLMHACYIPFCDVWRGDVKFCNLLIGQKVNGYQKIVRYLPDLPGVIENRLRNQ